MVAMLKFDFAIQLTSCRFDRTVKW